MGVCPKALYAAVSQDLAHAGPFTGTYDEACRALQTSLLKKWRGKGIGDDVDTAAVALDDFHIRATYCRFISDRAPYAVGFLRRTLGYIEPEEIAAGVRYSGGSSIAMPHRSTSGYAKHNLGPVSASSDELYYEYMGLLRDFDPPGFRDAIIREKIYGGSVVTPFSRVVTVPKTCKIDRVIAVEPTVNAYIQQGVKAALEARLMRVGIDLSLQPDYNRAMAHHGSLNGRFATIDLTAASDSISQRLLEYLLPADWHGYIRFVSSLGFTSRGRVYTPECIALTMGNAITFPLQTLIYLALAYEVYCRNDMRFRVNETVAVFGDDIIVDGRVFQPMMDFLVSMGFEPNPEKSFGSGPFRESCGADWYNGVNIRGVYLKRLDTLGDHYAARNLLAAWSHRWGIPLSHALTLLDDYLKKRNAWNLIPSNANLDGGIRVFIAPEGSRQDWSYHYKLYNVHYKRRKPQYVGMQWQSLVQGHLEGSLASGFLQERPLVKGKSRWLPSVSPNWDADTIDAADRWLYDESRESAGVLPKWAD